MKEEVRAGKFGKEAQAFIIEYPDCEFDARMRSISVRIVSI